MSERIALLADVHGNATALEAVLADAKVHQATRYWFLGDIKSVPAAGRCGHGSDPQR